MFLIYLQIETVDSGGGGINFSSFDYFLALARERSYTRAGDVLHITQQSLSAAIAALERELGCPLVVRRMPDMMAYPISFGYTKHAYPWSVLADFLRIARAQYPQPA